MMLMMMTMGMMMMMIWYDDNDDGDDGDDVDGDDDDDDYGDFMTKCVSTFFQKPQSMSVIVFKAAVAVVLDATVSLYCYLRGISYLDTKWSVLSTRW